jgi:hypothetical protein
MSSSTKERSSVMAEPKTSRPPDQAPQTPTTPAPQHRYEGTERVIEEGRDEQNDPRPTAEKLGGTPVGSDPRE